MWKGIVLLTSDDLTNANLYDKVAAADGRVEPICRLLVDNVLHHNESQFQDFGRLYQNSLVAFLVRLGSILEPASVLNGDSLALGGLSAGALLESSLGNSHCDRFVEFLGKDVKGMIGIEADRNCKQIRLVLKSGGGRV